jgi:hypothetical protein
MKPTARLTASANRCRRLKRRLAAEERARDDLIRKALASGLTVREVATIAGLSFARVSQIGRRCRSSN